MDKIDPYFLTNLTKPYDHFLKHIWNFLIYERFTLRNLGVHLYDFSYERFTSFLWHFEDKVLLALASYVKHVSS